MNSINKTVTVPNQMQIKCMIMLFPAELPFSRGGLKFFPSTQFHFIISSAKGIKVLPNYRKSWSIISLKCCYQNVFLEVRTVVNVLSLLVILKLNFVTTTTDELFTFNRTRGNIINTYSTATQTSIYMYSMVLGKALSSNRHS